MRTAKCYVQDNKTRRQNKIRKNISKRHTKIIIKKVGCPTFFAYNSKKLPQKGGIM